MASKIEYFMCFNSYLRKTRNLSDKELGQLFRALMEFNASGALPELEGRAGAAFDFICEDIIEAHERYAEKCKKASDAARASHANAADASERSERTEKDANAAKQKTKNQKQDVELASKDARPTNAGMNFAAFWASYPRKVGKANAEKAFAKVDVPIEVIMTALEVQKHSAQWNRDGGQFIPHPATWLNQRRWEDEPEAPAAPANPFLAMLGKEDDYFDA